MSGDKRRPAGSPTAGEPVFLAVGKVRRPHGVTGETLVEIYTDFPERLLPNMTLYAGHDHLPVTIRLRREHTQGLLLAFEGFNTPEEVGRFRNQILYSETADAPELAEDEFYYHELLGLSVVDENDTLLGELIEIIETGANDVYVVADEQGVELLLPAIPDVILDVNLVLKTMKVHLLPGLVESEDHES